MISPRLPRAFLHLYPRTFRQRFGDEWLELVEWRRTRTDKGRRTGSVLWYLTRDAVGALPRAYAAVLVDKLKPLFTRVRQAIGRAGNGPRASGRQPRFPGIPTSELRHAARGLYRDARFTLAVITSLTLGIGANTGIFSVVNAVLLRPLPYQQPERLVFVWNEFAAGLNRLPLSPIELLELRTDSSTFASVSGIWATTRTFYPETEPVHVSIGLATPNFLSTLGVEPMLGRNFLATEAGVGPGQGVVLSHEFWFERFAADSSIIGRTIRIEDREEPVLGILPAGFKLLLPPDAGVPDRLDLLAPTPWPLGVIPPDQHFLRIVARLQPGVSVNQADAVAKAAAERVRDQYAVLALSGDVFTVAPLQEDATRTIRPVLTTLVAGVILFLLIAAANVTNLALARASGRRHEMTIRACLGASRRRLATLATIESLFLLGIGTVCGLMLGWWSARTLWALRPAGLAPIDTISLDTTVVGFTILIAGVVALVVGIVPLVHTASEADVTALRARTAGLTRGTGWIRRMIVAAQVAIALVLLIGAGLMMRTFSQLQRANVGFNPERLLSFTVALSVNRFPTDQERAGIAQRLEEELADIAGVNSGGATSHVPFGIWANWSQSAPPEGTPEAERDRYHFDHRAVTPGFFETIDARLAEGRWFGVGDDQRQDPVIVIDRALAERVYPGQSAVGRRLHSTRYFNTEFVPTWATVIGVIENIRDRSPSTPSTGQVFWPFAQSPRWELTYLLRTESDPSELTTAVRSTVAAVNGELAPSNFRTADDYLHDATADTRFIVVLAGVFSILALVLATLGVYGVIAYTTAQRTNEIGIRIALGAQGAHVFRGVVLESVATCCLGLIGGLAATVGLTRFMESLLYDVSPTDPIVIGLMSVTFLIVATVASYAPARRAARVDPVQSLRME